MSLVAFRSTKSLGVIVVNVVKRSNPFLEFTVSLNLQIHISHERMNFLIYALKRTQLQLASMLLQADYEIPSTSLMLIT